MEDGSGEGDETGGGFLAEGPRVSDPGGVQLELKIEPDTG